MRRRFTLLAALCFGLCVTGPLAAQSSAAVTPIEAGRLLDPRTGGISVAEMTAIVEQAHRQHLGVAAHATSAGSIQTAIDTGVDSSEHGNDVTEEQLRLMRNEGIFLDLTPTWDDGFWTKIHQTITVSPAFLSATAASDDRNRKRAAARVQRVLKSGVDFATGSDMCWFYPGKTGGQATATILPTLLGAGMPALDIIRGVTTSAAEMLGWPPGLRHPVSLLPHPLRHLDKSKRRL